VFFFCSFLKMEAPIGTVCASRNGAKSAPSRPDCIIPETAYAYYSRSRSADRPGLGVAETVKTSEPIGTLVVEGIGRAPAAKSG